MRRRREGFTLIELLIVIVIIGILAAIAIPKFGKTREKAYFKAVMSDLRNLNAQQEIYYSNPTNNYSYAASLGALGTDFQPSAGVTVAIVAGGTTGFSATGTHAALAGGQLCAYFSNGATAVSPASTPGVVTCTGE